MGAMSVRGARRGSHQSLRRLLVGATLLAAPLTAAALAPAAHAYDITDFKAGVLTEDDNDEAYFQQAGGRPPFGITDFTFATDGNGEPIGNTKDIRVDIPQGLVPNPRAFPTCSDAQLEDEDCPVESQIGVQRLTIRGTIPLLVIGGTRRTVDVLVPLYNMERKPGQVARFAFNPAQAPGSGQLSTYDGNRADLSPIEIIGGVRPSDNGLFFTIPKVPINPALVRSRLIFWGVPGAARHDPLRTRRETDVRGTGLDGFIAPPEGGNRSVADKTTAFLSNPTSCAGRQTSTMHSNSYDGDGRDASYTTPVGAEGCDQIPFDPTVTVTPGTVDRDSPTGLTVGIQVPQSQDAGTLATAHARRIQVTLPQGFGISPSAAKGLETCADGAFGKGTDNPISCPPGSKVGTVSIRTPVLDQELTGDVYLGEQRPGDRYRLFVAASAPGVTIRLAGSVKPDPQTGQLTTVFEDNPQLPFSDLELRFDGGPRAVIASPITCEGGSLTSSMDPWSGRAAATPSTGVGVQGCGDHFGFEPTFGAATGSAKAGAFTPLAVGFQRKDGDQTMSGIRVDLPQGMTAKIKGVPRCAAAQIAAQACPESSRIGTASVLSGPGPEPYPLAGPVYLTNGYAGAPFGMVTIIRAVAGPYDLGNVVVRQALNINPVDGHVTVTSDPLPQIIEGVVLRMRSLRLDMNRKGFTRNPTSCGPARLGATVTSLGGIAAGRTADVGIGDCAAQEFEPSIQMAFGKRSEMGKFKHPSVEATVTQEDGEAGIKGTTVVLPKAVALAASNAGGLCEPAAADADKCPKNTIVGSASVTTTVLEKPLKGPVYFVKGFRNAGGRLVPTLPKLYIPLRGEATIYLRADTAVENNRLVTTFPAIPDQPVSTFKLKINGGKKGIIAATRDLCTARGLKADARFSSYGGKTSKEAPEIATACGKSPNLSVVRVRRGGGRLTVQGKIAKAAKGRVSVTVQCKKTTVESKPVRPRKGRWTARLKAPKACRSAARVSVTATSKAKGKYASDRHARKLKVQRAR
ncbi:hypothetical protein [Patulibacter sp. SYSU D01012]|uniref:hypothetical protein n=1 Tax=Patulibacter sp. SYSU D01012 TaxID=2817381 RepID=UPI001B30BC70|nr:hypothetical protein [Patulibacter sp. SYSU D01012]